MAVSSFAIVEHLDVVGTLISGRRTMPRGSRDAGVEYTERTGCLHFRDPDGHWLQLVDPEEFSGS